MDTDTKAQSDIAFLGHPAGLGWLSFSEFWERFSYYGMQTLLVLYMTHSLLRPDHIGHVLGFAPFKHALEWLYGPVSGVALASAIFGVYAATVYLTPIAGGFLADRLLGRTHTVIIGASLMALGHFLMAFDASFLIALLCLLLGSGCFKGNLATQVGDLYGPDDPRRADAYQIYMLGVQIAVIGSPLLCGTLAAVYGWHWGFGAAGVGMLIGLTIYLLGRPTFPPERPRATRDEAAANPPLSRDAWRNIIILLVLIPILAVASVGNQEIFNAYLIWAERSYDLVFFGHTMPVTYLISFGSIVSTVTMAGSVVFWRWWATRWREPDEMQKIILGVAIATTAPFVLAAAAAMFAVSGHRVSLLWAVAFEVLNDIGFANIFPVGMALYSRAAPKGLAGTMVSVYLLNLFLGNLMIGKLGGLIDTMPAPAFWLLHAGLMAGALLALVIIKYTVGRSLAPTYETPPKLIEAVA